MSEKTVCVVTGGGSGMGLEAAKQMPKDKIIVIAGRTVAKPADETAKTEEPVRAMRESPLLPAVVPQPVKKSLWQRFLDWLKSN